MALKPGDQVRLGKDGPIAQVIHPYAGHVDFDHAYYCGCPGCMAKRNRHWDESKNKWMHNEDERITWEYTPESGLVELPNVDPIPGPPIYELSELPLQVESKGTSG